MNLYQCQEKAKKVGFDSAKFYAMFPAGPKECQWVDAYMGMMTVDEEGLRDGFILVKQIDEAFPDLVCSDLWVDEDNYTGTKNPQ